MQTVANPLLITRDAHLIEAVLGAAAAAGVVVDVLREPEAIRRGWRNARAIFVGSDLAALVAGMALPNRSNTYLLGEAADDVLAWSVPLAASVMVLPRHSGTLTSVLADDLLDSQGAGRVVLVVGGSGGLGASTFAAGLGVAAAAKGCTVAVVEMDESGGGLDLLFGAETVPGWRWPDLRTAAGRIGDLSGNLPQIAGVDLVSNGRESAGFAVSVDARVAVTASLTRTHELVILDAGSDALHAEHCRVRRSLLVVGADVRSVVAARSRAVRMRLHDAEVVVRQGRGRRLESDMVADAVGLPLAGVLPEDPHLPLALDAGEPPGRGRRRWARECSRLVHEVLDDE